MDKIDDNVNKILLNINEGAKNTMQNLLDNILTYFIVTKTEEKFKKIDMEDLINDIISNITVLIEENNTRITHNPLPCLKADKSQITQLFHNLIINAIKFHGDEPPKIHISAQKKENNWIFEVKYNRIVIELLYQERIGFSVCEKIVQNHNGIIWIESKPGMCSMIFFTLPL